MPAQQNIQAEQGALKTFGDTFGRMPSSPQDWGLAHKIAYGSIDNLPDQYKNDPATLAAFNSSPADAVKGATTGTTPAPAPTPGPTDLAGNATALQGQSASDLAAMNAANTARTDMTKQGGTFFSTLQNALKAKTGAANVGIGQSPLYAAAGLTGYDTLQQSLANTNSQIQMSHTDLQNLVTGIGVQWQAQAQVYKDNYDNAKAQYDLHFGAAQDAIKQMDSNAQALILQKQKADADRNLAWYNYNIGMGNVDDHGNILDSNGKPILDGSGNPLPSSQTGQPQAAIWTDPTTGKNYDWSTYAVNDDGTPNLQAVDNIKSAISDIGTSFTNDNVPALTAYIDKNTKGGQPSPITAAMIQKAAADNGISWEALSAVLQSESHFGTDGRRAIDGKNPGNVGNTNDGGSHTFSTWLDGVEATAKQIADRGRGLSTPNQVQGAASTTSPDANARFLKRALANPAAVAAAKSISDSSGKLTMASVDAPLRNMVYAILASQVGAPEDLAKAQAEAVSSLQDKIDNNKGFNDVVGNKVYLYESGNPLTAPLLSGTPASDFINTYNQIKSGLVLKNLGYLRGMGRVTQKEFDTLSNAITDLNITQSPEAFKNSFKKIADSVNEINASVTGGSAQGGQTQNNASSVPSGSTIIYQGKEYSVDADGNMTAL